VQAGELTVWRQRLEEMAEAVHAAVGGLLGTERGREGLSIGAGGDRTAMVDRVAEDAVIARCEQLAAAGARFLLRSEELGDRAFGASTPMLLVDPVDGSINAKQGLPYHCTSLALLDGDSFGDAVVGVVRSLAGPGTYSAVRGGGVWRDGEPLRPLQVALRDDGRIPVVVLEAVLGCWSAACGCACSAPRRSACARPRAARRRRSSPPAGCAPSTAPPACSSSARRARWSPTGRGGASTVSPPTCSRRSGWSPR
jgi:Inositol monophosphatase family